MYTPLPLNALYKGNAMKRSLLPLILLVFTIISFSGEYNTQVTIDIPDIRFDNNFPTMGLYIDNFYYGKIKGDTTFKLLLEPGKHEMALFRGMKSSLENTVDRLSLEVDELNGHNVGFSKYDNEIEAEEINRENTSKCLINVQAGKKLTIIYTMTCDIGLNKKCDSDEFSFEIMKQP
jgi:hypothetical protein